MCGGGVELKREKESVCVCVCECLGVTRKEIIMLTVWQVWSSTGKMRNKYTTVYTKRQLFTFCSLFSPPQVLI